MTPFVAAGAAALGAWMAWPVAWPFVALAVVAAIGSRRPVAVAACMFLLTSMMADRALSGLVPVEPADFDGWVTLADDPRPLGQVGLGFTAITHGRRVDVTAHGSAAAQLRQVLAGERLWIRGDLRPVREFDSWSKWRHVVGRLTVDEVVGVAEAAPVSRFVNSIRRTLVAGADELPVADRALFLGMVIGDDRGQFPVTADDFRAAGLGHLLVVSGQNVAFILALVAPAVARFRPGPRLMVLLALLSAFALLTRFEPSVLRAVVMAGVSVGGSSLDVEIDGRKALALAVAALLVIDPFLVHVIGFQLSVSATAGIVWMSAPIAERLRGPRIFRVALATTASAQLAVSPVLITAFGPMPLASLPANVLAEPVAGPVMMWGSTGGMVAGVLGGRAAWVIHLPTRALLWWIQNVAHLAARAPTATVGATMLVVLAAGSAVAIRGSRSWRFVGGALILLVTAVSVVAAPSVDTGRSDLGDGAVLWSDGGANVLVLDGVGGARQTLEDLRTAGVRHLDLVVAARGNRSEAIMVRSLYDRFGELMVIAPPLHRVPGAHAVQVGYHVAVGDLLVEIAANDPQLDVRMRSATSDVDTARASTEGG